MMVVLVQCTNVTVTEPREVVLLWSAGTIHYDGFGPFSVHHNFENGGRGEAGGRRGKGGVGEGVQKSMGGKYGVTLNIDNTTRYKRTKPPSKNEG